MPRRVLKKPPITPLPSFRALGLLALLAALSVPASAAVKTWISSGLGQASTGANWSPAGAPASGDSLVFSTAGQGSCNFDLNINPANVTFAPGYNGTVGFEGHPMTFTGQFMMDSSIGRVEFRDNFGPFILNAPVTVYNGTFHIGHSVMTAVSSMTFAGGKLEMHDLAFLKTNKMYFGAGSILNLYDDSGGNTGGPTLTGNTLPLMIQVDGTVDVTTATFQKLSPQGLQLGTGSINNFSNVTFAGPTAAGSTAINFINPTAQVATLSNVNFADPNIAVNVNFAPISFGAHLTMSAATGVRSGPGYEYDPSGKVDWPESISFSGDLSSGLDVSGTGSSAVNGFAQIATDTLSSYAPSFLAVVVSSSLPNLTGDKAFAVVRYDQYGNFIASAPTSGRIGQGTLAVGNDYSTGAGTLYFASNRRGTVSTIERFTPDLVEDVYATGTSSGPIEITASPDGNTLFALEGGFTGAPTDLVARLRQYDLQGTAVAWLDLAAGTPAAPMDAKAIAYGATSGNVFAVTETGGVKTLHKAAVGLAGPASSVDISLKVPRRQSIAELGASVYVAGTDAAGTHLLVQKFDSTTLAAQGAALSLPGAIGALDRVSIKAAPDNTLMLMGSVGAHSGDFFAAKLGPDLSVISTATYDSDGADFSGAMAVLGPTSVLVGGAASKSAQTADAVTHVMTLPFATGPGKSPAAKPFAVAFDSGGGVWEVNASGSPLQFELDFFDSGVWVSSTALPGGVDRGRWTIVFDGSENISVVGTSEGGNQLSALSTSRVKVYQVGFDGTLLNTDTYTSGDTVAYGATVDGSGKVWITGTKKQALISEDGPSAVRPKTINPTTGLAVWNYDQYDHYISIASTYYGAGGFDAGMDLKFDDDGSLWVLAYSSNPSTAGARKLDLDLYHYDSYGLAAFSASRLPGYAKELFSTDPTNPLLASLVYRNPNLFAAADVLNAAGKRNVAFIRYNAAGAAEMAEIMHNTSFGGDDQVAGLARDGSGNLIGVGSFALGTTHAGPAILTFEPSGDLVSAQTITGSAAPVKGVSIDGERTNTWLAQGASGAPVAFLGGPAVAGVVAPTSLGGPAYAPNLDVITKDSSGNPLSGVLVTAVRFINGSPSNDDTRTATTDANGLARFNPAPGNWLTDGVRYDIVATLQGYLPSMRDQLNAPSHPSFTPTSGVYVPPINIVLTSTPSGRGEVDVDIINATPGALIFGSVQPAAGTNGKPVAMGLVTMDFSGTGRLKLYNVPFSTMNTLNITALDTVSGKAATRSVDQDLNAGTPLLVYASAASLDFTNALVPVRNQGTGVVGLDGSILGSDNASPLAGMNIQYDFLSAAGSTGTIRVVSDVNGRFQLTGLVPGTTYYAKIYSGCPSAGCYTGSFSAAAFGDAPGANDILYTGAYETRSILLDPAVGPGGQLIVYVQDGLGHPLPQSAVNIFPDSTRWCTGPVTCGSRAANPGPALATGRTEPTGFYQTGGLPPGNYTLQINTVLSSSPVVFNYGADGASTAAANGGCGSDDRRLTVESDSSITIYDGCGTPQPIGQAGTTGISSITVTIGASADTTGLVKGVLTFPAAQDLGEDPISLTLQPDCSGSACPFPGYTLISGPVAKTVPYSIKVASGVVYQLKIGAKYWGAADRSGGQRAVNLISTGTAVVNLNMVPAGRVLGSVYQPDGTLFTPSDDGTGAGIAASGLYSSGKTQLNADGTFAVSGLLPGTYGLSVSGFGPGFTFTDKTPLPKAVVAAGADSNQDIYLLAGVGMLVTADTTTLPSQGAGETWAVDFFRRGTDLSKRANGILLGDDAPNQFGFNPAPNGTDCPGLPDTAGFCPARVPSPSALDLHLVRKAGFSKAAVDGVRPYFVILNSSRNVVADATLAGTSGFWNGSTVAFETVGMTPAVSLAGQGQATLAGSVSGSNLFRSQDFDTFGGSLINFLRALPTMSVYDASGTLRGAGLVSPVPGCFAQTAAQQAFEQATAGGDFSKFKAIFGSNGPCFNGGNPFGFEIRGLTPGTTYTAVVTSPNYPSFSTTTLLAVAASTRTLNIKLDDAVGAGGTLTGVVKSTAGVVLANVTITAQSSAVETKTAVTNALGRYTFLGLPPGAYKLDASAGDYASGAAAADVAAAAVTVNFTLRRAGSSISGTVYAQTVPSVEVEPGAEIFAYNDTLNAASAGASLALYEAVTDADGAYTLDGLESGKTYKVFLKVPGRYVLNQSVTTVPGETTGVDFTLQSKPGDAELFAHRTATGFQFTVQNQDGLFSEQMWIGPSPYDVATAADVTSGFVSLPGAKKVLDYPLSNLVTGQTYVLHVEAAFEAGDSVSRELIFTTDRGNNSRQSIDSEILGDDSDDEQGNKSNEAHLDQNGEDPSKITIPPGAMIPAGDDAVPELTFQSQDAGGAPEADVLGTTTPFAGDIYRIGLSSVNLTDRGFELTLGYDKNKPGKGLVIAHYNPDSIRPSSLIPRCAWSTVPGLQSIDPLSGAITATGLKSFAGVLSVAANVRAVSSVNGYRPNGRYRTQSTEDDGTYAVVSAAALATAPPAAPVATGTAVGADAILWTWPKVNTATYYRLYPSTGGDSFRVDVNYYLMTGLSTGTIYSLKVAAVNTCNVGALSKSATTYALAAPPTAVTADPVFTSTAVVSWTDAENPAGTKYKIEWYKAATPAAVLTKLSTAPITLLTALAPNTSYYVRVRALNAKLIASDYDTPAAFWTLPLKVTAAPAVKTEPALTTAVGDLATGTIKWTWAAVPNAQYYEFTEYVTGSPNGATTQVVRDTYVVVNTYGDNEPHAAKVRAGNDFSGYGALSALTTGYTLNATPTHVVVTPAHASLIVAWDKNGALDNTAYQVQYKKSSVATWTTVVATASVNPPSKTFAAVTGQPYDVRVRSLNAKLVPGVPEAAAGAATPTVARPQTADAPSWNWEIPAGDAPASVTNTGTSAELAKVLAFPNPLLPGQPGVNFVYVPNGATIKITNPAGTVVRSFTVTGGAVTWNGSDALGHKLPNGLYTAHLQSGASSRVLVIARQR